MGDKTALTTSARSALIRTFPLEDSTTTATSAKWPANGDSEVKKEDDRSLAESHCLLSPAAAELLRAKPRSPILRRLTSNEIDILSTAATIRTFQRGQVVLEQGQSINSFGIIVEGTVRFMNVDSSGKMALLCILHAGEAFGWQSFSSHRTALFEGVAFCDCRIVFWDNNAIHPILRQNSSIAFHFVQECAERLIYLLERSLLLVTSSAEDRLRHAIAELARSFGAPTKQGVLLAGFSEEELAAMAGLSRYTVSHQLAKWRRQGWIAVNRREILIQALDLPVAAHSKPYLAK